jgi:hypothetical protein
MTDRSLRGHWDHLRQMIAAAWPHLTAEDIQAINGQREELMRRLHARYGRDYNDIEREVTELEHREARAANAARPSLGIGRD